MTNRMKNNTMKKIVAMMFAAMMIFSLAVSLAEADIWTCARCGKESRGNFCAWCGSSRPEEQAHCSVCGTEYDPEAGYAFCFNCGSSLHPDAVRTGLTAEPSVPADGESVRNEAARDAAANASSIQPGSTVFFGAYEQDSRRGNGTEPIEWIVLDVTDNQALLLSKYALDARQYNEWYFDNLTWRDSGMRAWLNGEFLNNSFTDAEKAALIMSFTG